MTFEIRRAVIEDAESLARVHAASWRAAYQGIIHDQVFDRLERDLDRRVDLRRERLHRPGVKIWVACSPAGHVVGFIDGGPIRETIGSYDQELYAVYLLQGWQSLGIGGRLVRILAADLKESGGERMLVWVLKDNHTARGFYERLGAHYVTTQSIEIGEQLLDECAYGWDDLSVL